MAGNSNLSKTLGLIQPGQELLENMEYQNASHEEESSADYPLPGEVVGVEPVTSKIPGN